MSTSEALDVDLNDLTLQYANRIKEFQMKPKTRVFIISSKFLKGLESFPETKKVPKVQNAELKNALNSLGTVNTNKSKNKKKSKSQKSKIPQIMKDYYPIDEKLWDDIVFHFGGGPEIAYFVCDDGTIDFSNFQINVKCGSEKKCIQTSMKTDLQTFHLQVLDAFGYDFNDKYKLCANNSAAPISTEGTVGGRIANEKLLILTVHYQEPDPKAEKRIDNDKSTTSNQTKKEKKDPSDTKNDIPENNPIESTRPLGLKNTGNSCYMNSVIQCFASVNFLTNNLRSLQNEAQETLNTIDRLGMNVNLRGLSGKLHLGQSRTAMSFISLMSNLKNNIPEKIDDNFTRKPPTQTRKGGRRYKNQKYTKSYTPSRFQTAIHVKKSMSLFSNNQQQDAHEFFSFLLDAVHDECPRTIEKLFYGKSKKTTTCALCGHESVIIEDFSSLQLPISNALKVLYSPYDLTKPMKRIQAIPDHLLEKVVLIGKTRKGNKVATKMSPEFIEVIALEIPDLSNASQNPSQNGEIDQIAAENKYSNIASIDNDDVLNNEEEAENDDENDNKETNNNDNDNKSDNKETNNNDSDNKSDNKETNNADDENDNNNKSDNKETNNADDDNNNNNDNDNDNSSKHNDDNNNKSDNNTNNDDDNDNNEGNTNENEKLSADSTHDSKHPDTSNDTEEAEHPNGESESAIKDTQYAIALLRVINKKSNEKTLPLLIKVPINVKLTEDEITSIVRERLAPILQQPDSPIKLIAPPSMFVKDDDKPLCRNPLGCHINCAMQPTRLESLFTKSEVPISVDELLDSFFSKMQLDEDNMWLCEVCKNNSCAYQQVMLLDTEGGEETDELNTQKMDEKDSKNQQQCIQDDNKDEQNQNQQVDTEPNETAKVDNQSEQVKAEQNKEEAKDTNNSHQVDAAHSEEVAEQPEKAENNETPDSPHSQDSKQPSEGSTEPDSHDGAESEQSKSQPNDKAEESQTSESTSSTKTATKPFHLPKCLVLSLKRFLSKNGRLAKDPTTVIVPHFIDVSRFVEFLSPDGSSTTKPTQESSPSYLYELCAVSNHAGSLQGGHYTAYGERKGSWYTFNDTVVSANNSIFSGKTKDCFGSSNAYLLFYSKVEDQK